MTKFESFKPYLPVVVTSYWMIIIIRGIELFALTLTFGWNTNWLAFESLGILYDFALVSGVLFVSFPIFYVVNKWSKNLAKTLISILLFLFTVAHFLILSYFIHQLIPLDIFLYQHPFEEVYFTITTSNIWITPTLISIGVLGCIPCFIYWRLLKKSKLLISSKTGFILLILGTFSSAFIMLLPQSYINKFTQNKSGFFYFKSVQLAFTSKHNFAKLNTENIDFFQAQYPHKKFTSKEYPLIHQRNKNDELFQQMKKFETAPNIVLLIVEGLSDEYIHNYQGVEMMPFLSNLKDSSLYWESCFTLGERSFAAVPSLLGGLPYGDLGFTLLKNYPHHHTLVNLLKSKNYHTSFYYGQAAWFHNKNSFFKYNNLDWLFEKESFDSTYTKIIVGDNDYFWGYNDKDLYNQYFKTLDSLPKSPYFNTFFTGTSHPPYIITNDEYYSQILEAQKTEKNKHFISTYGIYMKTILFVDDALKDFFATYQKRDDYENTIFIITGDHPMSELPRVNELTKYHVPLMIYSPKLKEAKEYKQAVSHLDLSTTLLTFLEHYTNTFPSQTASLGYSLFDTDSLRARKFSFMDGNRGMYEYYADGYFLRNDELFKVKQGLSLEPVNNEKKKEQLKNELENFKTINYRTSFDNLIMNEKYYTDGLNCKTIYSKKDLNLYTSKSEYINLVPETEVPNLTFRAEINFNLVKKSTKNSSIVFQIKDSEGKVLSWKDLGLGEIGRHQSYFDYRNISSSALPLSFSAYIWNKDLERISFEDLNVLLHEIK